MQPEIASEYTEEFKMHNLKGYEFCYKSAMAFPAEDLPSKGYQRFGKQFKFLKCVLVSPFRLLEQAST